MVVAQYKLACHIKMNTISLSSLLILPLGVLILSHQLFGHLDRRNALMSISILDTRQLASGK
jgi:hypothetical protein